MSLIKPTPWIERRCNLNPRFLTAIESRIWATVYGSVYAQGRHHDACVSMANAAVAEFRQAYPETE